jgi:hypothetical protein
LAWPLVMDESSLGDIEPIVPAVRMMMMIMRMKVVLRQTHVMNWVEGRNGVDYNNCSSCDRAWKLLRKVNECLRGRDEVLVNFLTRRIPAVTGICLNRTCLELMWAFNGSTCVLTGHPNACLPGRCILSHDLSIARGP